MLSLDGFLWALLRRVRFCKTGFPWRLGSYSSVLPAFLAAIYISVYSNQSSADPGWGLKKIPFSDQIFQGDIASDRAHSDDPVYAPETHPPSDAPNILLIMTDDVGFGATETFGGAVTTPTFNRLAEEGLRFNAFHTQAVCAATRAALLTGRNAHRVGFGTIPEFAYGYPGYNTLLPRRAATIGRVLRDNGYSTSWFGKNHNTPFWQSGPSGPFDRWPNALGFEYFYGFIGGQTNQWAPELVENGNMIEPPSNDPSYILDRDLADRALAWLRTHNATHQKKPWFMYYAPGTAHAPHQAPRDWVDKFKGRFDGGWDNLRVETFRRQKAIGVIPENAVLTPRPGEIPAWNSLSKDEQRVAARMMEAFAGMVAYADDQVGRVIDELRETNQLDNTIVIYIQGDNGGSLEGGLEGSTNGIASLFGRKESLEILLERLDEIGGPLTSGNYPAGWGWATNSPFQWAKGIASHLGGSRNGMVVFWPEFIRKKGEVRSQFVHVTDIVPTLYDLIGIKVPESVDGIPQMSYDGVSFLSTFNSSEAKIERETYLFEVFANWAIYDNGWMLNTKPERLPWNIADASVPPERYSLELYNLNEDYSQSEDVSALYPEKLAEMKSIFVEEAKKNNVFPLSSTWADKVGPGVRPSPIEGRKEFKYYPGPQRYPAGVFPALMHQDWKLSASLEISDQARDGVIATQGGRFGGWALLMREGIPVFVYRASRLPGDISIVEMDGALEGGQYQIDVLFRRTDSSADVTLFVDGRISANGHVEHVVPVFEEAAVFGRDSGTPVLDTYQVPYPFNGVLREVKITLFPD